MKQEDLKKIIIALWIRNIPDKQRTGQMHAGRRKKKIIRDLINGFGCAIVGAALACLILALILLKG